MSDEASISWTLDEYYRAFSTLNVRAIFSYLHEPALLVGPQGAIPLPTASAIEPVFGPVMENLRTRGYGRSEFDSREIRMLGAASAEATGIAVRYLANGAEMERSGITYLLRKTDDAWMIVVMVLHGLSAK